MSAWLALALPVLTALGIVAALGLPTAWALRMRGLQLPLIAVPAGFAVLALASIATPIVGIRWSFLPALGLSVALALVLLALRRWLAAPRGTTPRRGDLWLTLGAAAIGGAVITIALVAGLRTPDAVSQSFDANFHLNAVQYILDTGSSSPFTMDLTTPGMPVVYPTLWHAFVALIVQLSGATIPVATNAALFAVSAVVWPIGAVALGRAIAGPSTRVTLIAGAASAAFPNFPLFLAGYGVIYPNILSLTLFAYLLVATLHVLNLGPVRRAIPLPAGARWLLFVGALGASALAHPNVIHTLLAWIAIPAVAAAIRAFRGRPVPGPDGLRVLPATPLPLRRTGAIAGIIALIVVIPAAWVLGRTTDAPWGGFYGPLSGALQLLGGTPHLKGHAWAIALIVFVGALMAWRNRSVRWLLGSAATLAFLYWVSDSFPPGDLRTVFVNPWYNDPRRLASLVPFGAVPLAVLGASALWTLLRPGARRFAAMTARTTAGATRTFRVVAAVSLLLLVGAGQAGITTIMQALSRGYDTNDAMLLDADERALIERLDEEVPEGEVIANNPLNGSALAYAIADRQVLFPHGSGAYSADAYRLVDTLVAEPAAACQAAQNLDVSYVIDFGMDYIFEDPKGRDLLYKRMDHLEKSPILTEIDREGEAVLYQITGC